MLIYLPIELQTFIIEDFFSPKETLVLSHVCKATNIICERVEIWKKHAVRSYPFLKEREWEMGEKSSLVPPIFFWKFVCFHQHADINKIPRNLVSQGFLEGLRDFFNHYKVKMNLEELVALTENSDPHDEEVKRTINKKLEYLPNEKLEIDTLAELSGNLNAVILFQVNNKKLLCNQLKNKFLSAYLNNLVKV